MLWNKLIGGKATAGEIEYVGGVTTNFAGTTLDQTLLLTGALTGGISTSPAIGDYIIVYFATGSNGFHTLDVGNLVSISYPVIAMINADANVDTNLIVAAKRHASSNDNHVVFIGGTKDVNDGGAAAIQVWRGVNSTTPLDVTRKTATGVQTLRANPPAITPITSGAVIVSGGGGGGFPGPESLYTSPDLTGFISTTGDGLFDATVGLGYHIWESGAFDPALFVSNKVTSTSYSWCAVTLALRPA